MQPATEVRRKGEKEKRGWIEIGKQRANNETKKKFQKNKKKFATLKKFPTFAIPNETGANERSSES